MIKFIKNILLFFGLIILVYPIAVVVYGELMPTYFHKNIFYEKFAYGFSNSRFKEVKEVEDVDILFLGSSRAYRHYDPRIFNKAGYSSFNLGSSAQTLLQTEILVNRYLEHLNPKYVIFDIYPGMFSSDGVESSFDLISNDYNDWDTLKMALKLKNVKVLNTWIYAFSQELFHNSMRDKESSKKGINTYIEGGYVEREITTIDSALNLRIIEKWNYNKLQWKSFKSIIQKLKENNVKVLVVHSPRHSRFKNGSNKQMITYLKSLDIPYYNYNNIKEIKPTKHFYDSSHLNQNGVEVFNAKIINELFK